MLQTIVQRVDELEKKVAVLAADIGARTRHKDFLATVGTLPDDEISREADRLGREYRENLRDLDDRAGT